MLATLKGRLEGLGIKIRFEDAAVDAVAKAGFDPVYGARPLRRAIRANIEDPLSERMLEGAVKAGVPVVCGYDGKTFTFTSEADAAAGAATDDSGEKAEK